MRSQTARHNSNHIKYETDSTHPIRYLHCACLYKQRACLPTIKRRSVLGSSFEKIGLRKIETGGEVGDRLQGFGQRDAHRHQR